MPSTRDRRRCAISVLIARGSTPRFFSTTFAVPMRVGRCSAVPGYFVVDPNERAEEIVAKEAILGKLAVFDVFGPILCDFLGSQTGRNPLPRCRWKDLWSPEPSSFAAFEQQLAKLVEQALWAMAATSPESKAAAPAQLFLAEVALEPWMIEDAPRKKNKKKSKKGKENSATLASSLDNSVDDTISGGSGSRQPEVSEICLLLRPSCLAQFATDHWESSSTNEGAESSIGCETPATQEDVASTDETVVDWHGAEDEDSHQLPFLKSVPKSVVLFTWDRAEGRGRWAAPCEESSRASCRAVASRTFIDIEGATVGGCWGPPATRLSRSLSPARVRGEW